MIVVDPLDRPGDLHQFSKCISADLSVTLIFYRTEHSTTYTNIYDNNTYNNNTQTYNARNRLRLNIGRNRLRLNIGKCKAISYSRRSELNTNYSISGVTVENMKDLEVTIDKHINNKMNTAYQMLGIATRI